MQYSELTPLQLEVLQFINQFREQEQCNPTHAEIAEYFGWRSLNSARTHLKALERRGVLRFRSPGFKGYIVTNPKASETRDFIIRTLEAHKGDELERFIHRYGTPEKPRADKPVPAMWWEAPSRWNPCMTPREELEVFHRHRAKYDEAIAWIRSFPSP